MAASGKPIPPGQEPEVRRSRRSPDGRPSPGRPPTVSRQSIAEAAASLAPAEVTIRAVAERLGVSPSTLYYHVNGRDGLLRLAAEPKLAALELPSRDGMTWNAWLLEFGRRLRAVVQFNPEMVDSLSVRYGLHEYATMADVGEGVLEVLSDVGFSPEDAFTVLDSVTTFIVGFVRRELWANAQQAEGRGFVREIDDLLADLPRTRLPLLRKAMRKVARQRRDDIFDRQLGALIAGYNGTR